MNGSCEYCREFKDQARVLLCHLHAAAPALLEALEYMVQPGTLQFGPTAISLRKVRAAIAAAKGVRAAKGESNG